MAGEVQGSKLEESFMSMADQMAEMKGLKTKRAKELASELTLAFLKRIASPPELHGVEEWKMVAYTAKMIPVCRHPCRFTKDLERVLMRAGFRNVHFFLIEEALERMEDGG